MCRSQLVTRLGGLGVLVFNALRLIENNSVKNGLSRVQKRKLGCNSSIVKIDVAARVFFHEFIKTL